MALSNSIILARSDDFVFRVRVLVCKAAIAIANEAYGGEGQPTAAQHNKRVAFATKVLGDPDAWSIRMAWGVVSNAVITDTSADSDLEFQIASMWNAYAGANVANTPVTP
jgi:hypothetical protein